jgi:acyl transferase domain-containing protein
MLSVSMDEAELLPMLNGTLSVAVKNAPGITVVAGEENSLADLESRLSAGPASFHRI